MIKKRIRFVVCLIMLLLLGVFQCVSSSQSSRGSSDSTVTNTVNKVNKQSDRLAIVIGINDYASIRQLDYAVPDARLIKKTLETKGDFMVEYHADGDKTAIYPNKRNIMLAFKNANYLSSKKKINTLVVYFSGHGFEIDGKHYLAPIDAHIDFLKDTCISLDEVLSSLNKVREHANVMFFLDACRGDVNGTSRGESGSWGSEIDFPTGLAILKSSSAGQLSWELDDFGHGVYTYYLNEGLEGKADTDKDGFVSFNEITEYVWIAMLNWSRTNKGGHEQLPKSSTDEKYGKFFITGTGKTTNNPSSNNANVNHNDHVDNDDHVNHNDTVSDDDSVDNNHLRFVTYRDMLKVNGGTYTQQSFDEKFKHTISDFYIGKYEVTYEFWYIVYQWAIKNGYRFANAGREGKDGKTGTKPTGSKYEPVTTVNWRDCVVWCNAYSEMAGFTPVYGCIDGVLKDSRDSNASNCDSAVCDWSANGYRLPTEGEWQFAASDRGSTAYDCASGATDNYKNADACKEVAWYWENSGKDTHPVGGKLANGLGLHDMSGNVREWCWDWKCGSYPPGPETNYHGAASGSYRVGRGGSWDYVADYLQAGYRSSSSPSNENGSMGFRLVCVP